MALPQSWTRPIKFLSSTEIVILYHKKLSQNYIQAFSVSTHMLLPFLILEILKSAVLYYFTNGTIVSQRKPFLSTYLLLLKNNSQVMHHIVRHILETGPFLQTFKQYY